MEENKIDFFYDSDSDNLYIYKDVTSYTSVEFGDSILIDFDKTGSLLALEFLNASQTISNLVGVKVTKNKLKEISKVNLWSKSSGCINSIYFSIILENKEEIKDKLNFPELSYKSPVLAVCKN
jgi:uncharacterized protein YuzE